MQRRIVLLSISLSSENPQYTHGRGGFFSRDLISRRRSAKDSRKAGIDLPSLRYGLSRW